LAAAPATTILTPPSPHTRGSLHRNCKHDTRGRAVVVSDDERTKQ
jgi:hypothetical protein